MIGCVVFLLSIIIAIFDELDHRAALRCELRGERRR
jgi:hypothetical protein